MAGRERIYLDRFWNEFAATRTAFPEAARVPTTRRSTHNRARCTQAFRSSRRLIKTISTSQWAYAAKGKLTMPVLALGGEKSFRFHDGHGDACGGDEMSRRGSFPAPDIGQLKKSRRRRWNWSPRS